jgi:hypothetical protein
MRFEALRSRLAIGCLGLALTGGAAAGPADKATEPCGLDGLAWLAGTWSSEAGGTHTEESWLPPRAGTMLGVNRATQGSRMLSFEFLRIECGPEGATYWSSPSGGPLTPFRLKTLEARRVVFENPAHDFPTRILYWLDAEGRLHARIEGPAGTEKALEWTWRRAAP